MKLIERRIGLLFAVFVLAFVVVLGRAAWLQAVRGGELSADAHAQQTETIEVPSRRGAILDREGRELAVSEQAASVFATPYQLEDPAKAAQRLAEALDRPVEEILGAVSDRGSGFAYVARDVDLVAAQRVRKLGIEGVGVLPDSRRIYPEGPLAAQVVGAVGTDEQGLYGLEAARDSSLRGADGEVEVVRDALGDEIERDILAGAEPGEDLRLTIDTELQAGAEQVLADVGERFSPAGASAILMDPRDGQILALANWPQADPTDPGSQPEEVFRDLAASYTFEPGSTFKAFTVAGALSEGRVAPDTVFDLPPTLQVADRTIEEAHERGPVSLSVTDILAQSSNVGAVKVGLELGATRFDRWVRRFGFGRPTGSGLPGEEAGIVPDPGDYSGSSMGNLPIGQGLSVTPLQMAAAYAAIANGGILNEPRLIRGEQRGPSRRVLSRGVTASLTDMLEGVLEPGGTASEVAVPGYTLAGKTGTAEKAVEGGYSESAFVGSFVGYAPAEDPRLLAAIVVDEPQGSYYGSDVAAPAFGQLMGFALPLVGAPAR